MMKKITLLFMLCFACTQLVTAQTILEEGFEGASFPPAGWTFFNGTNGLGTVQDWFRTDVLSNTGTYSAVNVYENVTGGIAEDWLVTSQIDLTSASSTQLRFYSSQTYPINYGSNYEIKVSTNSQTDHADFTTVASFNENTVGPSDGFERKTIDLSAYDGMMIYIAFVHLNDDGDNWIIDDVEVRSPLNLDAKADGVGLNRYSYASEDNQLSVDIFNNGLATITSVDVTWSDGVNNYSENFNVNIAADQTQTVNHSTQVNYGSIEEKNIVVTIDNVNDAVDGDPSNNASNAKFATISQSGTKMVFIEEATGTWCGWCPRGAIGMDYMAANYPNTTALVAVHNADQMQVAEYDDGIGQYISGYPSGVVDRKLADVDPSQGSLLAAYNAQINEIVPVDLTISASQVGDELTISTHATFYSNFSAADTNYRLGVIITEDGVTGTGDGTNANNLDYDQVNYYSGGGNGPMGGYESLPDPVPATQMVYDHVGRALLGGFNGEPGSIPAVINDGETVSHDFNYTIPATSDAANMHIIALLLDQDNGSIVGTMEVSVTESLSVDEVSLTSNNVKIYPNPANDNLNISFEAENGNYYISVTDMLGRTMLNKKYNDLFGAQNLRLPISQLSDGHYIINITNGVTSFSEQFIVNKQ